jgi:hypothetical protein
VRTWSRRLAASSKRSPGAAVAICPAGAAHLVVRPRGRAARPRRPGGSVGRADLGHARGEAAAGSGTAGRAAAGGRSSVSLHERMPKSRARATRLAPHARGDVGPAVGVAVLAGPPHDVQARVLLGERQLQVRVVLVVAQQHVVAGPMAA